MTPREARLGIRLERARELLAEAGTETFRGVTAGSPGYYAQLCGALEAQLDLLCESVEETLRKRARL